MAKEVPVYLFVGFLESGKTTFIQETFEDPNFDSGDKTLLLVCEEGEVEYKPEKFAFPGTSIRVLEDKSELNAQNLANLEKETGAGRVIIEYNGMWLLQDLADALPPHWLIYQVIATADGSVAYDDIPDPLPFDVDAPVIEIGDDDFGIWYLDCQEDPQKYAGKTVRFLAQVCQTNRAGKNSFVPGRFAMTCCVQDIQFVGFPCVYEGYKALEQRSWVTVTARVSYKFHNIYRGKGPVLSATAVEPAHKPLNDVVTFS